MWRPEWEREEQREATQTRRVLCASALISGGGLAFLGGLAPFDAGLVVLGGGTGLCGLWLLLMAHG